MAAHTVICLRLRIHSQSTGRKFVRLGVPLTRNHVKRTKIWTLTSKIWTARCEHRDRLHFRAAKAWLHGCVVTQLEQEKKNCKQILRTWIYASCYYSLCLEILRFDSPVWTTQKYWTVPFEQRVQSNFFRRSKIPPVPSERSLNPLITAYWAANNFRSCKPKYCLFL